MYEVNEAEALMLVQRLAEEAQHYGLPNASESAAEPTLAIERPTSDAGPLADDNVVLEAGDLHSNSDDGDYPTVLCSPYSDNTYTLEGVIGRGGFSRVVRASDDKGRLCAVKMILKSKVYERPGTQQTLLCEKDIMAKVADLGTGRLVNLC